jgi:hypothetical protein
MWIKNSSVNQVSIHKVHALIKQQHCNRLLLLLPFLRQSSAHSSIFIMIALKSLLPFAFFFTSLSVGTCATSLRGYHKKL